MFDAEFWNEALIFVFFFYGLAFYSLGLALLVESGRSSALTLARSIRLLAGFGLLHGAHEWADMLERGLELYYDETFPMWLIWIRLSFLVASFLCLSAFGESLVRKNNGRTFASYRFTMSAATWYIISAVVARFFYNIDDVAWVNAADVLARYIIGVPGAVLACMALWRQRRIFNERGMELFVNDLTMASVSLALYGVVGQLFTGKSEIFPSMFINNDLFYQITGLPVQLFRAILAAVVALSMIRVLRALEVETRFHMAAVKRDKIEAEKRSHEELTRLNAELQTANEEAERLLYEVKRRDSMRGMLLQRITAAQEFERKRIARELHDGTGQALTGLAMGLHGMSNIFTKLENDKAAHNMTELETIATTALGELRNLINDLRPPQLDDMGLVAALQWMVRQFTQRGLLKAELKIKGKPLLLTPEVETTLFRIAQEGLTNAVKHAQAKNVMVTIDFRGDLTLNVADDGQGFDPVGALEPDTTHTAWGLLGMQERASLINANLELKSEQGKGTTLNICLTDFKKMEAKSDDNTNIAS
jgi:signal transduction histidine kinase